MPTTIDQLRRMSTREKIGQLFIASAVGGRRGTNDDDAHATNVRRTGSPTAADMVADLKLGGIVYYNWADNFRSAADTAALSAELQQVAAAECGIPLLLAADHETGTVSRLPPEGTLLPGNMAYTATGSPQSARVAATIAGRELHAMGLNLAFAPVCDVNSDPHNPVMGVRSFGNRPAETSRFAAAAIGGYQQSVCATAKHFPGHGATSVDSHLGLPTVTYSEQDWQRLDLPPFEAAVKSGVAAVMIGHVAVPSLDPSGRPATYSRHIVHDILRRRLGFRGVIVSDALNMREALGDDDGAAAVKALAAGIDLLLLPRRIRDAIDAIDDAVRSGHLDAERIDESVARILALKRSSFFRQARSNKFDPDSVGALAHRRAAADLCRRAVTVVHRRSNALPIKQSENVAVISDNHEVASTIQRCLTAARIGSRSASFAAGPPSLLRDNSDSVVLLVLGRPSTEHLEAARAVLGAASRSQRTLALVTNSPSIVADLASLDAAIAIYCSHEAALRAGCDVLIGRAPATGILPMAITRHASHGLGRP